MPPVSGQGAQVYSWATMTVCREVRSEFQKCARCPMMIHVPRHYRGLLNLGCLNCSRREGQARGPDWAERVLRVHSTERSPAAYFDYF